MEINLIKIQEEEKISADYNIINLHGLSKDEEEIINPLVPPTSGLRMEIFDKTESQFNMSLNKLEHFLRVIKAVAAIGKKELKKEQPNVLIVADDRYSATTLIDYASRIFNYEQYTIYHQSREGEVVQGTSYKRGLSRMSSPYASASSALYDNIDLVLMITASHNSFVWNGLKFYIERPIPISGGVMQDVSKLAISLSQIKLSKSYNPIYIDADARNNKYIRKIVSNIINTDVLKAKKVIMWPFLGVAPELKNLLESYGAEVIIIDESRNPPDPTHGFDEKKVTDLMDENKVKIAILLDADRDRLVFITKTKKGYKKLTSNELYTAMMNILSKELDKKFVNVRTIPSDPRCDNGALVNFITGVGYKHLGLIQFMAANRKLPQSQLDTAILYHKDKNNYTKISSVDDVNVVFNKLNYTGDLIFVLWEESGGHTFNILEAEEENNRIVLKSKYPLIGDKYPAPAIIVLCSLLEMGYDLIDYLDETIKGTRTTITATDEIKLKYMSYFSQKIDESIEIKGKKYHIGAFSNNSDKTAIIYFKSEDSMLYIRPSGTGPKIRIYIFGNYKTYKQELENVAKFVRNLELA
ncbi:MAG: hypothetical protein GF364_14210 [Candidatus Lokiarchaeota archaeon]|nr:hypothetical protein [Candidatus Lokiarchaeota archaeon]